MRQISFSYYGCEFRWQLECIVGEFVGEYFAKCRSSFCNINNFCEFESLRLRHHIENFIFSSETGLFPQTLAGGLPPAYQRPKNFNTTIMITAAPISQTMLFMSISNDTGAL
jgi:hypothetical protein